MNPIAHIQSPFPTKFGIPRQSGLVESVESTIVFEPEYRVAEALRGIEEFDYLWLIWQFSENLRADWSPTVRPPRLGGNQRMGVFATRSPFRPNALGLSSVRLLRVEHSSPQGPLLHVSGADLMDGTPIFDIKPYIPYTDAHPDARSGFAPHAPQPLLRVEDPTSQFSILNSQLRAQLEELLSHDPRPAFHHDPLRQYTMPFGRWEVVFRVQENELVVEQLRENVEK